MSERTFLQRQVVQLRHLLERAGNDPVLGPQLSSRLAEAERQLSEETNGGGLFQEGSPQLPRAAIFLKGGGVQGSAGVRPWLAGQALIQYEGMFIQQALHDEREAAKAAGRARRPRGAPKPELLFTGTPRGSFGLEFVPRPAPGAAPTAVHAEALENVAKAITLVAESDQSSLGDAVGQIPRGVIPYLQRFLKALADNGAELRFAFSDKPGRSLRPEQIAAASERMEREVIVSPQTVRGTFRGLTHESGYFDLLTDSGAVITGAIAEDLAEDDIERIGALINKACVAELDEITVTKVTGLVSLTYVLRNATEPTSQPATRFSFTSPVPTMTEPGGPGGTE